MHTIKPYVIKGFDYSGDVNIDFYEAHFENERHRVRVYGDNALAGVNWDLQVLSSRYLQDPTPAAAAIVRAQWLILHDLQECVA